MVARLHNTCNDEGLAVQRDAIAAADGCMHVRHDGDAVKLHHGCGARQALRDSSSFGTTVILQHCCSIAVSKQMLSNFFMAVAQTRL